MKYSGIGGQAVLEGIMMKNQDSYAVAVRRPDQEIVCKKETAGGLLQRHPALNVPFIRGVVAFIDSLVLGIGTLNYSASFYEEEGETGEPAGEKPLDAMTVVLTVAFSIVLVVALFMLLPVLITQLLSRFITSPFLLGLLEGVIRILLFLGYVGGISMMKDIRRVYMYHGAEHKSINCIEHGHPLTVDNVAASSRFHKRCGTSFMILIMLISVIFFMFLRFDSLWMRLLSRVVLVPVIAGISYEFLRLAGRSDHPIVNLLSRPGLWMQRITTREPERDMIEVAITAVEAVFDWKAYLKENFPDSYAEYMRMCPETVPAGNESEGDGRGPADGAETSGAAGDADRADRTGAAGSSAAACGCPFEA